MQEFMIKYLSDSFIPHGHCYLWKPSLVSLHIVSDSLIALAYYSIPVMLVYFIQRRRDVPFNGIFLLFSAFTVACGTTHLLEVWTLWHPDYWLSGALKAFTAMLSLYTAIKMGWLIPKLLALPSPAQLEAVNRQLSAEIIERRQIEEKLLDSQQRLKLMNEELEMRVVERTAAVSESNQQLEAEIASRQQALEALRESEERFRQLAENINQVFWMSSPDTSQILYISPAYEEIWGKSCSSLYEQPISFLDAIHPDDRDRISTSVSRQSQTDYDEEYRIVRPDGSVRWIRDRSFTVRDSAGQIYRIVGIAEDITQHKQAEEEIKKALEKEKELGLLKSRFITMASHEFRTPLATIALSAGVLERYEAKWTQEKKLTHLQRILTAVQCITAMLDDVLLIGKAEAGKVEFNPAPLSLQAFCSDLVAQMQLTAPPSHTLTFVTQGTCQTACMDEKLLRHILSNLLSNAIKYSPQGGTVVCELACDNGEAIFRIKDQGIGIPQEDIDRLFESFHRATNAGNIHGTGLGLAIVKKFVSLHQGEITVDSQVGVGTTFTVKLPLQRFDNWIL